MGHHLLKHAHKNSWYEFLTYKVNNKMTGQKRGILTQDGRTILIKTGLDLIPPYYKETSIIPKKIIQILNKIMRIFWWRYTHEKKKHWKKNNRVDLNKDMIVKLMWKFLNNPDFPWGQTMKAKFFGSKETFCVLFYLKCHAKVQREKIREGRCQAVVN